MIVKSFESLQDLFHNIGAYFFGYFFKILIDDIGECASIHKFDKHKEAVHVVV